MFSLAFRNPQPRTGGRRRPRARTTAWTCRRSTSSGRVGPEWGRPGRLPLRRRLGVTTRGASAVAVGPTGSDVTRDAGRPWRTFDVRHSTPSSARGTAPAGPAARRARSPASPAGHLLIPPLNHPTIRGAARRARRLPARGTHHRHRRTPQRGQVDPLQRPDQERRARGELPVRHDRAQRRRGRRARRPAAEARRDLRLRQDPAGDGRVRRHRRHRPRRVGGRGAGQQVPLPHPRVGGDLPGDPGLPRRGRHPRRRRGQPRPTTSPRSRPS